jgi:hypothetical protein
VARSRQLVLLLALVVSGGCGRPTDPPGDSRQEALDRIVLSEEQKEAAGRLGVPPVVRGPDGLVYALVPSGRASMRSLIPDEKGDLHERLGPAEEVGPFYLATELVTIEQFRRWRPEHAQVSDCERDDAPVSSVSARDARDYLSWLEAMHPPSRFRLPTHREFLYLHSGASRAPSSRDYPAEREEPGTFAVPEPPLVWLKDYSPARFEWCEDAFDPGYFVWRPLWREPAVDATRNDGGLSMLSRRAPGWYWTCEFPAGAELSGSLNADPDFESARMHIRPIMEVRPTRR